MPAGLQPAPFGHSGTDPGTGDFSDSGADRGRDSARSHEPGCDLGVCRPAIVPRRRDPCSHLGRPEPADLSQQQLHHDHVEPLVELAAHLAFGSDHGETVAPVQRYRRLVPADNAGEHGMETVVGAEGSFVAVNNRVSQSVPHLHVHVVPRRPNDGLRGFFWPRHGYDDDAHAAATAAALAEAWAGDGLTH